MANDKTSNRLKEIKNKFKELDSNNTGYLEYGEIVQIILKGIYSKCANCNRFWKYPIEYQTFLNDVVVLNALIMDERIAVLFGQLSKQKDFLEPDELRQILNSVDHSDYTVPGVFEDLEQKSVG